MRQIFSVFLICATIYAFAQEKPAASPTAPELTFDTPTHDFGKVKKGTSMVYKFKYKNTGKEPLIIYECRAGCGCTTPKCPKEPVQPGKSGYIEIKYDSTRVGVFTKEILISSNAKNGVVTLVIKGEVLGDMLDTPAKNEEMIKPQELNNPK